MKPKANMRTLWFAEPGGPRPYEFKVLVPCGLDRETEEYLLQQSASQVVSLLRAVGRGPAFIQGMFAGPQPWFGKKCQEGDKCTGRDAKCTDSS